MAITAGSSQPIKPHGAAWDTHGGATDPIYVNAAVSEGDVITAPANASGAYTEINNITSLDAGNSTNNGDGIVGVIVAGARPGATFPAKVSCALAIPGRPFQGTIVNNNTDIAAPTNNALLGHSYGFILGTPDNYLCLDSNKADAATSGAHVTRWGRQMGLDEISEGFTAPNNINPRVVFRFRTSVFATSN